jgi:hypothetical protein
MDWSPYGMPAILPDDVRKRDELVYGVARSDRPNRLGSEVVLSAGRAVESAKLRARPTPDTRRRALDE